MLYELFSIDIVYSIIKNIVEYYSANILSIIVYISASILSIIDLYSASIILYYKQNKPQASTKRVLKLLKVLTI